MPVWIWTGIGWALVAMGLLGVLWAFFGDRDRRRPHCRRCWYTLTPHVERAGLPVTCPECGSEHRSLRQLRKPRRRYWQARLAVVVVLLGWVVAGKPAADARGWRAYVPTAALVAAAPLLETVAPAPPPANLLPVSPWTDFVRSEGRINAGRSNSLGEELRLRWRHAIRNEPPSAWTSWATAYWRELGCEPTPGVTEREAFEMGMPLSDWLLRDELVRGRAAHEACMDRLRGRLHGLILGATEYDADDGLRLAFVARLHEQCSIEGTRLDRASVRLGSRDDWTVFDASPGAGAKPEGVRYRYDGPPLPQGRCGGDLHRFTVPVWSTGLRLPSQLPPYPIDRMQLRLEGSAANEPFDLILSCRSATPIPRTITGRLPGHPVQMQVINVSPNRP